MAKRRPVDSVWTGQREWRVVRTRVPMHMEFVGDWRQLVRRCRDQGWIGVSDLRIQWRRGNSWVKFPVEWLGGWNALDLALGNVDARALGEELANLKAWIEPLRHAAYDALYALQRLRAERDSLGNAGIDQVAKALGIELNRTGGKS